MLSVYIAEVCVFVVFAVRARRRVYGTYFHPRRLGMLSAIEEQDESVENGERKIKFQQARYHKPCPYICFGSCCTESGSCLRVDRIMSNHYACAREFCTGFRKKLLESIDDPEYVSMLGIATLLDRTHRSVKFMGKEHAVCSCATGVEAGQRRSGEASRNFLMNCRLESLTW